MWKEFKEFALKGNVFDLAIAVIIGAAFGHIVESLVNDLMMPVAGMVIGGINLTSLTVTVGRVTLKYGAFIQSAVDFILISYSIFLFIKLLMRLKGKHEKYHLSSKTTNELLTEIRDLLKGQHPPNEDQEGNKQNGPAPTFIIRARKLNKVRPLIKKRMSKK
ncbi:large conductance mechanosensitive channel protein MscL [Falsibacillus albus]|uniref:Large-conductance mechanosensitive channel n=1 Tax=Falsibacillus albus TaxID=2478915 RepID=A0A3L7K328_9BACI|nr:large conductance mechanosensitive channel protein MscL [Falsibacillus albus]